MRGILIALLIVAVLMWWIIAHAQTLPIVSPPPADIVAVSPATVDLTNAGGAAAFSTAGTNAVLALPAGSIGMGVSATGTVGNTGAAGARLVVVCGPVAGTVSLLFYAGTNNTPAVLANGVGAGVTGC